MNSTAQTIRDTNARILDYRTLKITIQTKSSHRLPTTEELRKAISIHSDHSDDCKVEQIGKSNQFSVSYKISNTGLISAKKNYKKSINGVWLIDQIKYGWSTYCPSIFYASTHRLSRCSKGSKCEKVHQFKPKYDAFVPVGRRNVDSNAFKQFKMYRRAKYDDFDFVEDIDFETMEGIQINHSAPAMHDSHSNDTLPHRPQPHRKLSNDSITSSSSESLSDHNSHSRTAMGDSNTKRTRNETENQGHTQHDAKKKQKLQQLLRQQLQSGKSPNFKLLQESKKRSLSQQQQRKQRRSSPPPNPPNTNNNGKTMKFDDTKSMRSAHSNGSNKSMRTSRSTVHVAPKHAAFVTDSSSSSESSSPLFNSVHGKMKRRPIPKDDMNALQLDAPIQKEKKDHTAPSKNVVVDDQDCNRDESKTDALGMRYLAGNHSKRPGHTALTYDSTRSQPADSKPSTLSEASKSQTSSHRNGRNHPPSNAAMTPPPHVRALQNKAASSSLSSAVTGKSHANHVRLEQKEMECDSPKTVSSITSAEKVALRTVQSVLGANEMSHLSRVPIIDPNKHTVSYITTSSNPKPAANPATHIAASCNLQAQATNNNHSHSSHHQNHSHIPPRSSNQIPRHITTDTTATQNNPTWTGPASPLPPNHLFPRPPNSIPNIMNSSSNSLPSIPNHSNMNAFRSNNNNTTHSHVPSVNAPPFYPSQTSSYQGSSIPNYMNNMSHMTGNILAGALRPNPPNAMPPAPPMPHPPTTHQQPPLHAQQNMYPVHSVPPSSYHQANNAANLSNLDMSNLNINKLSSNSTSILNKESKHEPHSKDDDRKYVGDHNEDNASVGSVNENNFVHEYKYKLQPPQKTEDYHWLCYWFRSSQAYSCRFGKTCQWRHYDFDMRADVATQWKPNKAKERPNIRQLSEARILRESIETKFPWLIGVSNQNECSAYHDSSNPYTNIPTPPSIKKQRVENHKRMAQKDRKQDMEMIARRQLVANADDDMEEKQKQEKVEVEVEMQVAAEKKMEEEVKNEQEDDNVTLNAEEFTEADIVKTDKQNGNEENVKEENEDGDDKNLIDLSDLDTIDAILTPFGQAYNAKINYYTIGLLAKQQLQIMMQRLNQENDKK